MASLLFMKRDAVFGKSEAGKSERCSWKQQGFGTKIDGEHFLTRFL